MKTWLVDSLVVGTITLTGGAMATFSSSGGVGAALAGGTAGAAGGAALVTKRREDRLKEEISQFKQVFSSTVNQLKHDIAANNTKLSTEVADVKSQLRQLQSDRLAGVTPSKSVGAFHKNHLQLPEIAPLTGADKGVQAWLNALSVPLSRIRQAQEKDDLFDKVAFYLGSNYSTLAPLHQKMKRSLETKMGFNFSIGDKSEMEIKIFHHFRHLLKETGVWLSYYRKTDKIIWFDAPSEDADITKFLRGGWLEHFVSIQVSNFLKSNELEYQHMANFCVTLYGKNYELDLLFLVNNTPILIECKSGQITNPDLDKLCRHRKALSVPKETALLVHLDMPDAETENWTKSRDITVANISNLLSRLSNALGLQPRVEPQQINPPVTSATKQLSALLNKEGLRPLPEHRQTVISELIKIFGEDYQPTALVQIKKMLAESLQISGAKLQDILNAVLRSHCFLDGRGETVTAPSFSVSVSGLVSDDTAFLEKKCIESYAKAVLAAEPNYFENPESSREFEEIVGGKVPDASALAQLKAHNPERAVVEETEGKVTLDNQENAA